eukprot:COSAG04_NODE_1959_length_5128_cov_5.518393_1_plen_67_part_00
MQRQISSRHVMQHSVRRLPSTRTPPARLGVSPGLGLPPGHAARRATRAAAVRRPDPSVAQRQRVSS